MIVDGKVMVMVPHTRAYLDEIDIAYLAGIIDGEGYIGISKGKQPVGPNYSYEIHVSLHMMDGVIPKMFLQYFGGKVSRSKTLTPRAKHSLSWKYLASGAKAMNLLLILLPRLIIKKQQANVAIYLQKQLSLHPRGKKLTEREIMERERLLSLSKDLKRIPVNDLGEVMRCS